MFHGQLDYFQKPPLGSRPNTKPGDHGTPHARNHWVSLFYDVWGLAWVESHWYSVWLRALSRMASLYTWIGSVTTLHDVWRCVGTAFGHSLSFGLSQIHGHGSWLVCESSGPYQWSRLEPSYEFHFEGLSKFSPSVEGLVQIQDVNPRI